MSRSRLRLYQEVEKIRERLIANESLSGILLQCKRIATELKDKEMMDWIDFELVGMIEGTYDLRDKKEQEMIANKHPYRVITPRFGLPSKKLYPPDNAIYYNIMHSFSGVKYPHFCGDPISKLEHNRGRGFQVMAPHDFTEKLMKRSKIDKETVALYLGGLYLQITPADIKGILSGVRGKVIEFLDKILESQPLTIIDSLYQLMVQTYSKIEESYPELAEKFESIRSDMLHGSTENLSGVASTCRRILKSFADKEVPPQKGRMSRGHKFTEDKFINRILALVEESVKSSSQKELLMSYFSNYIHAVNRIASKGDKRPITRLEAESCAIHTFLIIAELIRLKNTPE